MRAINIGPTYIAIAQTKQSTKINMCLLKRLLSRAIFVLNVGLLRVRCEQLLVLFHHLIHAVNFLIER